jgi:hypothetical protein
MIRSIGPISVSLVSIWVCWSTMISLQRLANPPQVIPKSDMDSKVDTSTMPVPAESLFSAGEWNVNGWEGGLLSERVSTLELEPALTRILTTSEAGNSVDQSDFANWLASAKLMLKNPLEKDGKLIYKQDDRTTRIRIATERVDGKECFACAAVAMQVERDRWQIIAMKDRLSGSEGQTPMIEFDGATIQATRIDTSGVPIFQLLQTSQFDEHQIDAWKNSGWSVFHRIDHPTGAATFLCRRENEGVTVWVSGVSHRNGLAMLTRFQP